MTKTSITVTVHQEYAVLHAISSSVLLFSIVMSAVHPVSMDTWSEHQAHSGTIRGHSVTSTTAPAALVLLGFRVFALVLAVLVLVALVVLAP